jgi:hypothetical protein
MQLCKFGCPICVRFCLQYRGTIVWDGNNKAGVNNGVARHKVVCLRPLPLPQQGGLKVLYFLCCGLNSQLVLILRVLGWVKSNLKSQSTGKLSLMPKINYHPVIYRIIRLIAWMASKRMHILFVFGTKCNCLQSLKQIEKELYQSKGKSS